MSILKLNATKMTIWLSIFMMVSSIFIKQSPPTLKMKSMETFYWLFYYNSLSYLFMHVYHIYHQNTSSL